MTISLLLKSRKQKNNIRKVLSESPVTKTKNPLKKLKTKKQTHILKVFGERLVDKKLKNP